MELCYEFPISIKNRVILAKDRIKVQRTKVQGPMTDTQTLFNILYSYDCHGKSTPDDTELTIGPSEFYFKVELRTFYCTKLARLVPKIWDFLGLEINRS